jgi:hypothetical protein
MMPGPVSDSYDPVWGTSANADIVRDGIQDAMESISCALGGMPGKPAPLLNILDVARSDNGPDLDVKLSERELRLLRFACRVALEEDAI